MALLSRRPRPPRPRALVAASRRVRLDDGAALRALARYRQGWQDQAWDLFDAVGEIKYAFGLLADAVMRVRWFPAIQEVPGQDPVPLEADTPLGRLAAEHFGRLDNSVMGLAGIASDLTVNLSVAGEGWLVGETVDGAERWDLRSTSEVEIRHDGVVRIHERPGDPGRELAANAYLGRVWRRHSRYGELADSNMRAVLDPAEQLLLLDRMMRSQALQRLWGGIALIPEGLTAYGGPDPTTDSGDGEERDDPFMADLEDAINEPIHDPGAPSALTPLLLRGPADELEKVRHLTFDRPFDAAAGEQRRELLGRLGNGLNLPLEKMLGASTAGSHWNLWLIEENFVTAVKPLLVTIAHGLTVFLRDGLEAVGVDDDDLRQALVWFDPAEIVVRPNRAQDAKDAHRAISISDEALRRELRFDDEDAPDEEELARRVGSERGAIDSATAAILLRALLDGATPSGGNGDGTRPSPEPAPTRPPEELRDPPSSPDPDTVVAAAAPASRSLARLAGSLAEADRALAERILAAADAALGDALRRAGARLRSAAQGQAMVRRLVAGAPAEEVGIRLGRTVALALLGDEADGEDALLADAFAGVAGRAETWIARAQADLLARVADEGGDLDDQAALAAEQAESRREAVTFLVAGLAALALTRLFAPAAPGPPTGEADLDLEVPPALVRSTLQIAGGASAGASGEAAVALAVPAGGPGTGPFALDLIRRHLRAALVGWRWDYGPPSSRSANFEPHLELDGVEFTSWEDDVLANTSGWPEVSHYRPGDHIFCRCAVVPALEREG